MGRKLFSLTVLMLTALSLANTSCEAIDGVRKAELIINGQSYVFPIGDNDGRELEIYYVKKWLQEGDKTALEMFMGTEDEKHLFIGDDFPLWAKISKDGRVEVSKP